MTMAATAPSRRDSQASALRPRVLIDTSGDIDALKRVGCTDVLSLSAVGSLKAELPPGHFVIVDQFIDRSFAREKSFFGDGCVAHVSVAHPVCPRLGDALEASARGLGLPVTRGGTYLVMEGPQFSSLAESKLYRSWGCDVIGMTNMPEAKLAREAELCYATVAMVTDFDCWHPGHDHVTVEDVVRVLLANADKARALVKSVVPALHDRPEACGKGCDHALEHAARHDRLRERFGRLARRLRAGVVEVRQHRREGISQVVRDETEQLRQRVGGREFRHGARR